MKIERNERKTEIKEREEARRQKAIKIDRLERQRDRKDRQVGKKD